MHDIRDLVDRVAGAFGAEADATRVESVVASLLAAEESRPVAAGACLHIDLSDCSSLLTKTVRARAYDKIRRIGSHVDSALAGGGVHGSLTLSTTSLTAVASQAGGADLVLLARMLDDASRDCGAAEIEGLSGGTAGGRGNALVAVLPEVLHATDRVRPAVEAASDELGVDLDLVLETVAAIRRCERPPADLLRVRLATTNPVRPILGDAALLLRVDAAGMIDEALRNAPDAPVHDICAILTASAFAVGRSAAGRGDAAAAAIRARCGLDVRFDGFEVRPGPDASLLNRTLAAALLQGFRSAAAGSRLTPATPVLAFSLNTSDHAARARTAEALAERKRVHVVFTDGRAGEAIAVGPYRNIPVESPAESDWMRRGGRLPVTGS